MFAVDPGYMAHRVALAEQPVWEHNLPRARYMTFRWHQVSGTHITLTMRVYTSTSKRHMLLKLPFDARVIRVRRKPISFEDGSLYLTVTYAGHTQTVKVIPND